jgi:predicted nucleotidyltransferase
MKTLNIGIIRDILVKDERVVFVYLYGSFAEGEKYKDLDIAVYSIAGCDALLLSTDLKIALHEHTGMAPDFFDVRVINGILDHGDLFSLLYLKHIFATNQLLLDKDFDARTDFIEKYNMKYRECEGLIEEVLL